MLFYNLHFLFSNKVTVIFPLSIMLLQSEEKVPLSMVLEKNDAVDVYY